MPISGSIEYASRFGYLDSETFSSASALDAHTLRTIVTNANQLISQEQPVFTGIWRFMTGSLTQRTYGCLAVPAYNHWSIVQPLTNCPKPPGVDYLLMKSRLRITPGRVVALQFITYGSPFQDPAPPQSPTFFLTGSGSGFGDWLTISGTVPCRVDSEERIGVVLRGFLDDNVDTIISSTIGTGANAMVSSSFSMGGSGPTRFMPTVESSAGGLDGDIASTGAYVMFYRSGTNDRVEGPSYIVSSSMAKGYDFNRQSAHFLPPASQNLIGTNYRIYEGTVVCFASIRLFTGKRRK